MNGGPIRPPGPTWLLNAVVMLRWSYTKPVSGVAPRGSKFIPMVQKTTNIECELRAAVRAHNEDSMEPRLASRCPLGRS